MFDWSPGAMICWLRNQHKWRRLRKGEYRYTGDGSPHPDNPATRICDRCEKTRLVKARKVKGVKHLFVGSGFRVKEARAVASAGTARKPCQHR